MKLKTFSYLFLILSAFFIEINSYNLNTHETVNADTNKEKAESALERKKKLQKAKARSDSIAKLLETSKKDKAVKKEALTKATNLKAQNSLKDAPAPAAPANTTTTQILSQDINNTFTTQNTNVYRQNHGGYPNNKLFLQQLDDIYRDMIYKDNKELTEEGAKAAIKIFTSAFDLCDANHDNVLDTDEFTKCMQNDSYLSKIQPPQIQFSSFANYSYTNSTGFYNILFNTLDSFHSNFLNLHDYMLLRLMVFSWKKCSVLGPYIEETSFECAFDIATGFRTLDRGTVRNLYKLGLEISNGPARRQMDFITFILVASSGRLYTKINLKEDLDAGVDEFILGLDKNILPMRYNEEIINQMFDLVGSNIDLRSFIFYDNMLKIFDITNASKLYYLNLNEFINVINHYLFPKTILSEIQGIPQNNLTADSYYMSEHSNMTLFNDEGDHLLKFLQLDKSNSQVGVVNMTFNLAQTASRLFNVIDHDSDGYINFKDFGLFIQVAYIYSKSDEYNQNRIVAFTLFEKFSKYDQYPAISNIMKKRAERFKMVGNDNMVDLHNAFLILRIDDIFKTIIRSMEDSVVYEVELKTIFDKVNLKFAPDSLLNKCLRASDEKNIPRYDWECAFIQAETSTLTYLQYSKDFILAGSRNLTLTTTTFYNVDPSLK